jgi:hypothetical protein
MVVFLEEEHEEKTNATKIAKNNILKYSFFIFITYFVYLNF